MINDGRGKMRFDVVVIQEFACERGLDAAKDPDEAIEPAKRC